MICTKNSTKLEETQIYMVGVFVTDPDPELEIILTNLRRRLCEYWKIYLFLQKENANQEERGSRDKN